MTVIVGLLALSCEAVEPPSWPDPRVYDRLLDGKDLNTLGLLLRRGNIHGATLSLSGDLSARYRLTHSRDNLFPGKMQHQIGTYRLSINRQQLRAIVEALRRGRFSSLQGPQSIIIDTPLLAVLLAYQGKARAVKFPMDSRKLPEGFQRMWHRLVAVFSESQLSAERAIGFTLSVPEQAKSGLPIPIELEIKNVGETDILIPNPASLANEHCIHLYLYARKLGAHRDRDADRTHWANVTFGREKDVPTVQRLWPSGTIKLRNAAMFPLKEPGQYWVRGVLILRTPDLSNAKERNYEKTVFGKIVSKEYRTSVK